MADNEPKSVTIYTRGVSAVTGAGGYGVVLVCGGRRKELSGGCLEASNNRMDILAVVTGLRALKVPCAVTVINNNAYIAEAVSKGWVYRWQASGWLNSEGQPTAHADLWQELIDLCGQHQVTLVWRRYDPRDQDHARCDLLAHEAANSQPAASSSHVS
jgi:ribonuclease HI